MFVLKDSKESSEALLNNDKSMQPKSTSEKTWDLLLVAPVFCITQLLSYTVLF